MGKLLFGPSGIPIACEGDTIEALGVIKELGLDAMELSFTHGVNLKDETAKKIAEENKKHGVRLSVHGPYYINLNAKEKEKREASKFRVYESARVGAIAGATAITFHAAYYLGIESGEVKKIVAEALNEIVEKLRKSNSRATLKPETTGKPTQYGSIDELLELCGEVKGIMPYVDFAHLHARTNGGMKTKEDFRKALEKIEKFDKSFLKDLNIQVSGIEYSVKGERRHLPLELSDLDYKAMLEALVEFDVDGAIISESPNIEQDAILMKKYYQSLI